MLKTFCRNILSNCKQILYPFRLAQLSNVSNVTNNKLEPKDIEVERIVWMDLEMTGLNIHTDKIMEVAVLITDANLNIVAEGPDLIIHQPKEILENMNEWCVKQHGKTGLTEACLKSSLTIQDAEHTILNFFQQHLQPGMSPLAGNSVFYDRMFIKEFMPKVDNFMHYRVIDVSCIKELCRRWNPDIYKNVPKKEYLHRALTDIKESVDELKYYKQNFMKVL